MSHPFSCVWTQPPGPFASTLSGFFGGMVLPIGILGIWFAVVVGWAWLAVMSLRLNRLSS